MQETQEAGIDPWVGKHPWRKKWQPTPVSLPGKSYGFQMYWNTFQYRGDWRATVHNVAKSQTRLKQPSTSAPLHGESEDYQNSGEAKPWTCRYHSPCGRKSLLYYRQNQYQEGESKGSRGSSSEITQTIWMGPISLYQQVNQRERRTLHRTVAWVMGSPFTKWCKEKEFSFIYLEVSQSLPINQSVSLFFICTLSQGSMNLNKFLSVSICFSF